MGIFVLTGQRLWKVLPRYILTGRHAKEEIRSGMVSPFTATFYADILRDGRKERIEFDVIDDQAKLGEMELGFWIKRTIDQINRRNIAPFGSRQGRYGVYGTFERLWSARWFRFDRVLKYGFDRNYVRFKGTGIPAG